MKCLLVILMLTRECQHWRFNVNFQPMMRKDLSEIIIKTEVIELGGKRYVQATYVLEIK